MLFKPTWGALYTAANYSLASVTYYHRFEINYIIRGIIFNSSKIPYSRIHYNNIIGNEVIEL